MQKKIYFGEEIWFILHIYHIYNKSAFTINHYIFKNRNLHVFFFENSKKRIRFVEEIIINVMDI